MVNVYELWIIIPKNKKERRMNAYLESLPHSQALQQWNPPKLQAYWWGDSTNGGTNMKGIQSKQQQVAKVGMRMEGKQEVNAMVCYAMLW